MIEICFALLFGFTAITVFTLMGDQFNQVSGWIIGVTICLLLAGVFLIEVPAESLAGNSNRPADIFVYLMETTFSENLMYFVIGIGAAIVFVWQQEGGFARLRERLLSGSPPDEH